MLRRTSAFAAFLIAGVMLASIAEAEERSSFLYIGLGIGPTYMRMVEPLRSDGSAARVNGFGFEIGAEVGFRITSRLLLYLDTRVIYEPMLDWSDSKWGQGGAWGHAESLLTYHFGIGAQLRLKSPGIHFALSPGASLSGISVRPSAAVRN